MMSEISEHKYHQGLEDMQEKTQESLKLIILLPLTIRHWRLQVRVRVVLCQGGHRTTLAWKKKKSLLLYIKFKNFMIFLP